MITKTWIWLLITRPLISIDPNAEYYSSESSVEDWLKRSVSTDPDHLNTPHSHPHPPQTSSHQTPNQHQTSTTPSLAPRWYSPVPLPRHRVPRSHRPSSSAEEIPKAPQLGRKRNNPFNPEDKHIHKRRNYDLSHQGLPLFEFRNANTNISRFTNYSPYLQKRVISVTQRHPSISSSSISHLSTKQ